MVVVQRDSEAGFCRRVSAHFKDFACGAAPTLQALLLQERSLKLSQNLGIAPEDHYG
eukprot:CAMPEP_0175596884 /NCGR_PEP_ID=MMETSP0096-20121207/55742_1 /TAXON_ID=311494 /ORGANISM="Alexandrium monilatum, Strain CCMP3105" /LENGTH=56 /DNA_ID=CAMNT_0016901321 /DNA_START=49 /DNA_END=215 /DNA_ORIENTATION=-